MWLVGATPGPADAKVKKTGLGTESSIPTPRVDTAAEAAAAARAAGFRVVALELASEARADRRVRLQRTDLPRDRQRGARPPAERAAACDAAVYVPQPGKWPR